jgi:hypothetical protein
MEPFSSSVFRGLTGIVATSSKICTRGTSRPIHIEPFVGASALSYTLKRIDLASKDDSRPGV